MRQTTTDAVRNVLKERKAWTGSLQELCKKHGISAPTFYKNKSKVKPRKTYVTQPKAPTVIDIPLHSDDAVYIVRCSISNVRRVLGELNENR